MNFQLCYKILRDPEPVIKKFQCIYHCLIMFEKKIVVQ